MDAPDELGFEPLQQIPALRERVQQRLEALIISGAFAPGARLVESELAERLGVSRGPVREALQLLERDGWIDLRARQGAFVHVPTDKEIDDFFDLRRVLEMEAARLATHKAQQEDMQRLRQMVEEGFELLHAGKDPFLEMEAGIIHQTIADIADNHDLSSVLQLLSKRGRWYIAPLKVSRREDEWDEHAEIVEAICSGDSVAASTRMGNHVDHSRVAFKKLREAEREPVEAGQSAT